jgi:hypothetical protein
MNRRSSIYKIIPAIIAFAVVLGAASCSAGSKFTKKSTKVINSFEECGVNMDVVVTGPREIEVNFENKSRSQYIYGSAYALEYYKNGDWYEVPLDLVFTMEGHMLGPAEEFQSGDPDGVMISDTGTMTVDLSVAGKFPQGHYRIIKELSVLDEDKYESYCLAAEFDLEA